MIKAILFDADGVALKKYQGYFSERFAREHNAPVDEMRTFFINEFKLCQRGKADLKQELEQRLPKWNWSKGVDAFLEYWFTTDAMPDREVLDKIKEIRKQGIACYLATDQEKYRAQYLLDRLNFKNQFDHCFFSCDLGYLKDDVEYFMNICKTTGLKPEEVAYLDDDPKNVAVAASLGIKARFYSTLNDLEGITQ